MVLIAKTLRLLLFTVFILILGQLPIEKKPIAQHVTEGLEQFWKKNLPLLKTAGTAGSEFFSDLFTKRKEKK